MLAEYFKADGVHFNYRGLIKMHEMIKRITNYVVEGPE